MGSKKAQFISQTFLILLVTLVLVKAIDLVIPFILPPSTLFPPSQKVLYRTIDFDAVASINQFGFRGNETSLEPGQIIAIGDSFTFGFGNNDDDVWPNLLQDKLDAAGFTRKVYNLGVPGTNTEYHIDVARTYVNELKPSIVLFSVLLADDFQQVSESRLGDRGKFLFIKDQMKSWFPGWYNIYLSFRNSAAKKNDQTEGNSAIDATSTWGADALKVIKDSDLKIPDDIMPLVADGQINPGIFSITSKFPERALSFWKRTSEKDSIERETFIDLSEQLKELNRLVEENGGRLVIFSMSSGAFVSSRISRNYEKYGFRFNENNFSTLEPEMVLNRMATENGFEFVPSLENFRTTGEDYFFEYDGHLNPGGNALVASILAEYLLKPVPVSQ